VSEGAFTNDVADVMALPKASNLAYEGLAPTYARTIIIEWCAAWLLVAAVNSGIYFFSPVELLIYKHGWIFAPYFIILVSVFLWAPLVARSRGFAIRERDIHYKSGVAWRKTVSLPFNRIQHVELESGPLERFFKLTTLKFFTAGGGSTDMKIPALTFAQASKLRTYVIEKAGVDENDTKASANVEHH